MVQTIRPASTISSGSWTAQGAATLHESTDETSQDGDTTRVEGASGAGTFEIKFETGIDPLGNTNHTVKMWGKGVGSGAGEKVDVDLYVATTKIATIKANWTPGRGSYAELTYTLSGAEADAIGDYSDLRVRIIEDTIGGGSERFNVTQIYMEIPDAPATITQSHYRIRNNDDELINSSTFSHAIDTVADINAEELFRIRFEIGSDGDDTDPYKIQENYASAGWVDMEAPGVNPPLAPGVLRTSFAPSNQYNDGAATADVMSGEGGAFVAGSGEESNNTASVTLAAGEHTEFEFCLIIRKLYGDDGTSWGFTSDGDTVQYRLVKSDGTVLTYSQTPTITVKHPVGLIGGTFTETPGQVIIADDDGNIYALVEHAQLPTPIVPSMVKSSDGGDTWIPQDDADWANSTIELEAADLHYIPADDKIYMGMTSSTDPDYREFQVAGHGSPDQYTADSVEVDAVGDKTEQVMAIVRRSDNTVVMFYNELATDGKLRYKIRSSGGTWGSELNLEAEAGTDWSGCQIVLGASDKIHIIYSGDAAGDDIFYRTLDSGDTLSSRTSLTTDTDAANFSPYLKPVYWDDGGTEKIYLIYFKTTDNKLYARVVSGGSLGGEVGPIITNAVLMDRASSGSPTAAAVVDGSDVYVVYAHETDLDLYLTKSENGGTFDTDVEILDAVTAGLLSAISFTHNSGNGSAKVIGIIYDDERFGEGNTGGTVYFEYEISGATTHEGAIAIAASAAIVAIGENLATGIINIAGSGAVVTLGENLATGLINISASAAVVVAGAIFKEGAVNIAGSGETVILGENLATGKINIAGSAAVDVLGENLATGIINIAGSGAVVVVGTVEGDIQGAVNIAGSAVVTTLGENLATGQASTPGTAAVVVLGENSATGAINIAGSGIVTALGEVIRNAAVNIAGSGIVTALGEAIRNAAIAISGSAAVIVVGEVDAGGGGPEIHEGAIAISGSAAVTCDSDNIKSAKITISGAGGVTVAAVRTRTGAVVIIGSASVQVSPVATLIGAVAIEGSAYAVIDDQLPDSPGVINRGTFKAVVNKKKD